MTTIIHSGDVGTIIRLTITDSAGTAINVSSATVMKIYLKKPDDTKKAKTAVFYTDGSDGIIQCTTIAGDIDTVGLWQVQGYVETTDGKFFTAKSTVKVEETLYTT